MARAYFDNPFAPAPIESGAIQLAQLHKQAPSPLESLSDAIEQPFVTDVIVPGISRIRDELRLKSERDEIAERAQARRDAARAAMGQAFFRESQAKIPETPTMPHLGPEAARTLSEAEALAMGASARGVDPMSDPRLLQKLEELRGMGLAEAAGQVSRGVSAAEAGLAPRRALLEEQLREQMAQPTPVAAPAAAQDTLVIRDGKPRFETGAPADDPKRLARRAYENHLRANPGDQEGALAAAHQAHQAAVGGAPTPAATAVERPELLEEAAAFREQAAQAEADAAKIAGTRVRETFADHAMDFMDALDAGDAKLQREILASVGGSVDVHPSGEGAVGAAITGKAGADARKALLDLRDKYLEAQRKEASALKIVEAKKKKPARTGKGTGGGGRSDAVLLKVLSKLNAGEEVSDADRKALKRFAGMADEEIDLVTTDPSTWSILSTRVRGRRNITKADKIVGRQPTGRDVFSADVREKERKAREAQRKAERTEDADLKRELQDRADALKREAERAKEAERQRKAVETLNAPIRKTIEKLHQALAVVDADMAETDDEAELAALKLRKKSLESSIKTNQGRLIAIPDE